MTDKESSRSPISDKPLRHAGQSLEEERRTLIDDKVESVVLVALFYAAIAAFEWYRYYVKLPPIPWAMTGMAIAFTAFAAWRLSRVWPRLRALRQGIEGERAVGQYLEGLRGKGYRVFHDVLGSGFNVDHVLIGPAGIFTVETKTWSKPASGEARITFDDEQLSAGNRIPDRDPVVQAVAQANWLTQLLKESTGRAFRVFPVVLFPGWYVEPASAESRQRLWILEPKALPAFLEREPQRISDADSKLAAFHLSRFIRSGEQQRARKHLA